MATEEITISELELADKILGDMNIPVDTATETRAVTLKQLRAWLGSSLPTGFIVPAVGKISDERFTLLDGKTLSREGTYSAFCNKVVSEVQAGNWFACSEEEYAQDISDFGQCGKFVVSNDYVRIPTITRFIGATITLSEIGKTYKESLPNISGEFRGINAWNGDRPVIQTGALYSKGDLKGVNGSQQAGHNTYSLNLDASRSSSTYQDGAKVQPDHTKYPYYMVISTEGQTASVEIDINKVYEDLNLKANTTLSNVSNVSSSFKEQSVGWGMPDYSAGIVVTSEFSAEQWWTATKAGWYVISAGAESYFEIRASKTDTLIVAGAGPTPYILSTGTFVADVGQRLYCSKKSGSYPVATYYPFKGAN